MNWRPTWFRRDGILTWAAIQFVVPGACSRQVAIQRLLQPGCPLRGWTISLCRHFDRNIAVLREHFDMLMDTAKAETVRA